MVTPICCDEFKSFINDLKGLYIPIGEGEISGSLSLNSEENDKFSLNISDGWNFAQNLTFNFCPCCGTKQEYK